MKSIFKFIYDKKDEGIYRKRIIFGIKIITNPNELRLNRIEEKIDNIIQNNIIKIIGNNMLKLRVYEIYSKHKESSYKNKAIK
ncbi:hypothetical protein EPJ69_03240 [Brachyspira aalborgi]|uniref:Uncharacterized protein n=1 Tax=Brachyspira aalborgi TaxID=29522 RepID=A0A5C8E882_9SPIR|nr:hypothetical protein [Brachyspira aalborgi]TXJ33975.1 hypothetical protein EPJ69_03240 [Brachyspira aalborgi]